MELRYFITIDCRRFANKLDFKCQSKDFNEFIFAFKAHSYKLFIELLRNDYGIEDNKNSEVIQENIETERDNKDSQNQRIFIAYIGEGNNSSIVRNTLKTRSWWTFNKNLSIKKWDFIWTQWIQSKVIKQMTSFIDVNKRVNYIKFVYNKLNGNYNISNK